MIHWEVANAVDQTAAGAVLGLYELLLAQVFGGIDQAVGEARAADAGERINQTPGMDYWKKKAAHGAECAAGSEAEQQVQAAFLRDIFGNPFRPISINPIWLSSTVTNLAIIAYEERALPSGELDTTRLAVLADVLEDNGCDNEEILGHLRSPGPHVRGCQVVDLILGRE